MNTKLVLRSLVVALALTTVAAPAAAGNNAFFGRWQAPSVLEGPWQVTLTPKNCTTGQPFAITFVSYITFAAGGTLIESSSNPGFQPGQRSAGHGYWERSGRKTYRAYYQAFVLFDSPPYQRGTQSVDQNIVFQDSNHWTSDAVVTFRNSAGATIPPSGCADAVAERLP